MSISNSDSNSSSSREFLSSLLHNRILLFNTVVIASVLIFLAVANMQQETDLEEYAIIPYDHTPSLPEGGMRGVLLEEAVYDRDTFQVEYSVYSRISTSGSEVITGERVGRGDDEVRPLPMSPATSVFYIDRSGTDSTDTYRAEQLLAVTVKKVTDEPAVYALKIKIEDNNDDNDDGNNSGSITTVYFSDPFSTGYNSIMLWIPLEVKKGETVKLEIEKIRILS